MAFFITGRSFVATIAALCSGLACAGSYTPPGPMQDFPSADTYYPPVAARAGQQGTVTIHVCVDVHGKLTEPPTLLETSGSDVLDNGAVSLANAGNGHYHPALQDGVAVAGCGGFRVAFRLRVTGASLPVGDPRFPTIGARIAKLDDELNRRIEARINDPASPLHLGSPGVLGGPGFERAVREYSRSSNDYVAEFVGMEADFLDDVDYLQDSPEMPEAERAAFREVWPENRQAVVVAIREAARSVRDFVRVMDEMGDYMAFSVLRRSPKESDQGSGSPEDPQLTALKRRAKDAFERLKIVTKSSGEAH